MGCTKTLTLSGGCDLETCTTESRFDLSPPQIYMAGIGFAPDLCYCLVVAWNTDLSVTYFFKYDPGTNSLIAKGSYAGEAVIEEYNAPNGIVYEPVKKKFVMAIQGSDEILLFDPVAETISTFSTGLGSGVGRLVWVQPRGRIYGSTNSSMIYLDLDLLTGFSVGTFWFTYTMCYAAATDSLYGIVSGGLNPGLHRYDLATNAVTTNVPLGATTGCCVDTTRNVLLAGLAQVLEVNLTTLAVERTTPVPALSEGFRYNKFFDPTSNKMFCTGYDNATGTFKWIGSYLCQAPYTAAMVLMDMSYGLMIQFAGLSAMTGTEDPTPAGVRRICLT